ncbi:hypothetical protein INQ40_11320 [Lysobacter sp. H21R4]|uniref:hypothetical protein n=1 Tax=Lysobacter sp. H21R4 TaxID=2781021 RepID=UPI00188992E1|nr:hypothetical protein [Lysobacter sp. H21R4]QOY62468.1 hypothetical protein INQ40_11320 [Lysobacter sp. H21R4]
MTKDPNESRDMNRDPITKAPGSHPVGVGVGGLGGAAAGAGIGALFGPIGMLVGGAVGTLAGASAGKSVAESIDPTGEHEYWRNEYSNRPYANPQYNYDDDYAPAYEYGNTVRAQYADRQWDDSLEQDIRRGWEKAKAKSRLTWEEAKDAARDAFDRSDRTYRTYSATDNYYRDQYKNAVYYKPEYDYDTDYRPAYRYGTQARSAHPGREWNDELESDLGNRWDNAKATSRMSWSEAKDAVRDAWHNVERALPGDFDRDGR